MTARLVWRWLRLGLVVFFCYILFCQFFLVTHAMSGVFRGLSRLAVVPAAQVEGQYVSYHAVVELAHGMKGFAGATENGDALTRALRASVYRLYVQALASELGVEVTADELAAYPLDVNALQPGLDLAHWNERQYRKYIVEPLLLAQKTELAFSKSDTYQTVALETMTSLRKKIAQGMPLGDVAQNFSQDQSALVRGDLGIMSMSLLPDWLLPAVTLEPGDISEVLSAPEAYWTVTLIEFYPSDIPEQAAIHFRGVATSKKSFGAVVADKMMANPPWVFVW